MSAQRKPVRNLYFDYWAEKYELHNRMPYAATEADWVGLNRLLTKSGKLSERMTLDVWKRGVNNYLASDVGIHALHKLCSGPVFVSYWKGPTDRWGKPYERASQIGSAEPVSYASWHPKFLKACWTVAQRSRPLLNAVAELMEEVHELDEVQAFRRLKEIEQGST